MLDDLAPTCIRAPALQATRVGELFQGLNEAPAPPGTAELCHLGHSTIAPRRSVIRSLKVSLSSSVSQDSSAPIIVEENRFLSSIIASMRSSRVPIVTNLCTKTFLRWPMRNARSVA